MFDDTSTSKQHPARASLRHSASVTDIATRRREENVLGSITLVLGGVNYGTIPVRAPYAAGKPFQLYLVPSDASANAASDALQGPLDCLITDDVTLAAKEAR